MYSVPNATCNYKRVDPSPAFLDRCHLISELKGCIWYKLPHEVRSVLSAKRSWNLSEAAQEVSLYLLNPHITRLLTAAHSHHTDERIDSLHMTVPSDWLNWAHSVFSSKARGRKNWGALHGIRTGLWSQKLPRFEDLRDMWTSLLRRQLIFTVHGIDWRIRNGCSNLADKFLGLKGVAKNAALNTSCLHSKNLHLQLEPNSPPAE